MRFVVSQRKVHELLALYPELGSSSMRSTQWTDEVVAELAATGAVDVVDLKGLYEGDWVDATPSAELYGRVAEAFPEAWLEDRAAERRDAAGARAAPRPADVGLPDPLGRRRRGARALAPRCLNSKPSRFGSRRAAVRLLRRLRRAGIEVYGGGQFELGPGRGQIQHLASLFHADAPNDVAPKEYNDRRPEAGPAAEPAPAASREPGFR